MTLPEAVRASMKTGRIFQDGDGVQYRIGRTGYLHRLDPSMSFPGWSPTGTPNLQNLTRTDYELVPDAATGGATP